MVFTLAEVAIGRVLGPLVIGRFVSPMLRMRVEMILHLASFFAGGAVFGVMTPGVRLAEPGVAAILSVVLSFSMSFFLPHTFVHFSLDKIFVSGGAACVLAVFGTYTAERALGHFK
jgi:hypothetical protein